MMRCADPLRHLKEAAQNFCPDPSDSELEQQIARITARTVVRLAETAEMNQETELIMSIPLDDGPVQVCNEEPV